jgi:hypothetical protein
LTEKDIPYIMAAKRLLQDLSIDKIQLFLQENLDKYVLLPLGVEATVSQVATRVGISASIVYILAKYIVYNLYIHPLNRMPGPSVGWIPFMGNFGEIFGSEAGVPHKRWVKKYGGILKYNGPWNTPRLLVTDDVLLKQVLTTDEYDYVKTPESSAFLRRFLGNGLLVAEVSKLVA